MQKRPDFREAIKARLDELGSNVHRLAEECAGNPGEKHLYKYLGDKEAGMDASKIERVFGLLGIETARSKTPRSPHRNGKEP